MADQKFDIVFRGDIVIGKPLVQVKKNLAHLFKLPPGKVDGLFSGKSVVLKKGVDAPTAKKYQAVLNKAGAITSVVSQAEKAQEKPRARKLTLAPLGVNIAPRGASTTKAETPPEIDTAGISLRGLSGNLVDESEVESDEPEQVDLPSWNVADVGADIGDESQRIETPPLPVPDFDVADAGAQMGVPQNVTAAIDISTVDFDVAPAGSDMGEKKANKTLLNPNTDHIKLS